MRLEPKISFAEFRQTCQLLAAAKSKAPKRRSTGYYIVLALVCLTLGLAPEFPPARIPAFTLYAVLALLWLFNRPLSMLCRDRSLKRFYADEEARLNDQILIIDESGISSTQGNGTVSSHFTWQAFIRLIEAADAFIFLPSPNTFIRVPKKMVTSEEQELIKQWSAAIPVAPLKIIGYSD
jgi:hypothetical protein